MRGHDRTSSGPGAVTPNPPTAYPPEHVHASKKLIAARLGKGIKAVNKLMYRDKDPLPVAWCRRRSMWVIVEADLLAWDAKQFVPRKQAEEMGLVPKRRKAA